MLSDGTGAASQVYVCICRLAPNLDQIQPEIDKSSELERSRFRAQADNNFGLVVIQVGKRDHQAVSHQVVDHSRSILFDGIGAASVQDRPYAAASSTRSRLRIRPNQTPPYGTTLEQSRSQLVQATLPPSHVVPSQAWNGLDDAREVSGKVRLIILSDARAS